MNKMILRSTLMSAMLALTFFSCSTDKRKNIPIHSLGDILTNLSPIPEQFKIDPSEESLIKGERGTVVYIPANAFQYADGTPPSGSVEIKLKECYSLTDMIGENLQTVSGDQMLQTAGMIYLDASANGKQVLIKEGTAIVIGFPKKKGSDEMDLFYDVKLNDSVSTWVPDYRMYELDATEPAGDESEVPHYKYPIEMTDDLFDYSFGYSKVDGVIYELKLKGGNRTILDYINDPTTVLDSVARKFVRNDWRVHYNFRIDKNGRMTDFKLENDPPTKYNAYALKTVKGYLENAPAFDLSGQAEVTHDRTYTIGVMGGRKINNDRFKKKFRAKYSQFTDQAINKMGKDALDGYIFAATKMGWINCDKFLNIPGEKIDFVVKTALPKDTKVLIVFQDINSIMNGSYSKDRFIFDNVPLNRKIKVIGISYASGKSMMSSASTTIDKSEFELTGFKEFTLDQLDRELDE